MNTSATLHHRATSIRARTTAGVSSLWTRILPGPAGLLTGAAGLDLQLGLRVEAEWRVEGEFVWTLAPAPGEDATRLTLASSTAAGQQITVRAGAVAGLEEAAAKVRRAVAPDSPGPMEDGWIARLERAAVRTVEQELRSGFVARIATRRGTLALLEAVFQNGSEAAREQLATLLETGDLTTLLAAPAPGVRLMHCQLAEEAMRERTFSWRVPFLSGSATTRQRVWSAWTAFDDEFGRVSKLSAGADSERATRRCASLLSLETALATRLAPDLAAPGSQPVRLRYTVTGARPEEVWEAEASLPALDGWLRTPDPSALSRRIQFAWRTLLPAASGLESLPETSRAPLLLWSSLPIATAARAEGGRLHLESRGAYWNWPDGDLRKAMAANRITQTQFQALPSSWRGGLSHAAALRTLQSVPGDALFRSLLYTEARLIDRLLHAQKQSAAPSATPVEALRAFSRLLGELTNAVHSKLQPVFGSRAASALGPVLLAAIAGAEVTVRCRETSGVAV